MITSVPHNYYNKADKPKDCSLGNVLFVIAGIIGVAVKNNYRFGFSPWPNQDYFVNPLPPVDNTQFRPFALNRNYQGYDVGFQGFNIPDNTIIDGYFGSLKYWEHCEDLVRFYLTMKDIAAPYEDTIVMHCRSFVEEAWYPLGETYYKKALEQFPAGKKIVVVTNNIEKAKQRVNIDCEYVSNSPIVDFYLMSHTRYFVMANSSLSWMAAYLGKPEICVAPENWYAGSFHDCPKEDNYPPNCIRI